MSEEFHMPRILLRASAGSALAAALAGCTVRVATEPIEVKPIYIRVDVEVRADRAVEQYLAELNRRRAELEAESSPPSTNPSATTP